MGESVRLVLLLRLRHQRQRVALVYVWKESLPLPTVTWRSGLPPYHPATPHSQMARVITLPTPAPGPSAAVQGRVLPPPPSATTTTGLRATPSSSSVPSRRSSSQRRCTTCLASPVTSATSEPALACISTSCALECTPPPTHTHTPTPPTPSSLPPRYTVGAVLGAGSFGIVRLATEKATGRAWAVKQISKMPKNATCTVRQAQHAYSRVNDQCASPGLQSHCGPSCTAAGTCSNCRPRWMPWLSWGHHWMRCSSRYGQCLFIDTVTGVLTFAAPPSKPLPHAPGCI
jgi:hypothetical protein